MRCQTNVFKSFWTHHIGLLFLGHPLLHFLASPNRQLKWRCKDNWKFPTNAVSKESFQSDEGKCSAVQVVCLFLWRVRPKREAHKPKEKKSFLRKFLLTTGQIRPLVGHANIKGKLMTDMELYLLGWGVLCVMYCLFVLFWFRTLSEEKLLTGWGS